MGAFELNESLGFADCVAAAKQANWRLDEVLPPDAALDFERQFLPPELTLHARADFLSAPERLQFNQITGKSYVNLFHFVEEYIIRDVERLSAAADLHHGEQEALRRFAAEERKHQVLFERLMDIFDAGFGAPCRVLDLQSRVADLILRNSPLAVLLTTLHLELITQAHFTSSIASNAQVDATFVRVLEAHWAEEQQHAALDFLEIKKLAAAASPEQRARAVEEFGAILDSLHELLALQATHDVRSLEALVGRTLGDRQHVALVDAQLLGYVKMFVLCGLEAPALHTTVSAHLPEGARELPRIQRRFEELMG